MVSPSHCFSFSWARARSPPVPACANPPPRDLPPLSILHPYPGSPQGGGCISASSLIREPRTGSAFASPAPRHSQPIEIHVRTVGLSNHRWAVSPECSAPAAIGRCLAGARASVVSERRRFASGSAGCIRRCGRRRRCAPGVLDEAEATRPGRKAPQARSGQARRGFQD